MTRLPRKATLFVACVIATAAALLAARLINQSGYWFVWVAVVPIYATYRTYTVFVRRMTAERQEVQRISDLHLATIEALVLAIEAKDYTAPTHIRRLPTYAAALARL